MLTFSHTDERPILAAVPSWPGIQDGAFGDVRSIIYFAAFRKAVQAGDLSSNDVAARLEVAKSRPQLVAINGRPC